MHCDRESKELLSLCLKKIKGLNKVKLMDAVFIWTEPHSRRIKLKITIQKEVFYHFFRYYNFSRLSIIQASNKALWWNSRNGINNVTTVRKSSLHIHGMAWFKYI